MDTLPSFPCPYCGDDVGPSFKDSECTIPSGLWICETCSTRSGTAFACGSTRPDLRLVPPADDSVKP